MNLSTDPAGALHVTALQAAMCMERFGAVESTAPPLAVGPTGQLQPVVARAQRPSTAAVLGALRSELLRSDSLNGELRSQLVSEAVCFATPPDNPGEGRWQSSSAMARRAAENAESGAAIEAVAVVEARDRRNQLLLSEALQASADVRRQRRRALVRALRAGRKTARSLLEAPGTALASLASFDGAELLPEPEASMPDRTIAATCNNPREPIGSQSVATLPSHNHHKELV